MARLPWSRRSRPTETDSHAALSEAAPAAASPKVPPPRGYEDGIPLGGTTVHNPGGNDSIARPEFCAQLYGAYLSCPWASAAIDIIARTITAGGLDVVPDSENDDDQLTPARPPEPVRRLQELFSFVNPRQDVRQLMRGLITDLLVFGDGFLELVWVGGRIVALYPLDSPSMIPIADEHGVISRYEQVLDPQRTATFEPHEVLQVSLDAPRGGVYGVGYVQKALLPITAWLFTAGLLKETMRKGDPARLHADMPSDMPASDIQRWRQQYVVSNLGVHNVGVPIITKGGAKLADLGQQKIAEYLATLDQKRDEIIASMGVPPRKLSIAEPGQLGGTGEGAVSDKTFRVNTCGPIAELVLEKVNFDVTVRGFGITDWRARFAEVDWRDDETIEKIRDMRLRNGSWVLNRYRAEIGEPPVDGGDDPVLVDRQNLVAWADLPALSRANVEAVRAKGEVGAPANPAAGSGTVTPVAPTAGKAAKPGEDTPDLPTPLVETSGRPRGADVEARALEDAWARDFQRRRRAALRQFTRADG